MPSSVGMPMPAVKFPSEPPPTAASPSFQSIWCALHWHAVDAAFHCELAMLVVGFQRAEFAVETFCLLRALDADVDFDHSLGGHDVGARASAEHARIHGHALLEIIELPECSDLVSQFDDGAVSFAGIESSV